MRENHETYVEWLRTENRALVDAARINLAVSVPTCPGWNVRDLLIHHGSFQEWITGMLVEHAQFPVAPRHIELSDDVDVIDWYVPIGDQLVATLLEVGPDVAMWDVTGQHLSGAWARRQASETSVHRVDAQLAHGTARPIEHASDYIDEMLNLLVPNLIKAFGAPMPTGTMHLESTDEDRIWRAAWKTDELEPTDRDADARLVGTTSDLFLALWRRPNAATLIGDHSTLASWNAAVGGT
jgi:uncharacterized protein (TIGR03083 family)